MYQCKYRYLIQLVISFVGFTYWLKVLQRISHTNHPLAIGTSPCSRALFIIVRLSKRSKSIISMLQFVWMLLICCWYEPFGCSSWGDQCCWKDWQRDVFQAPGPLTIFNNEAFWAFGQGCGFVLARESEDYSWNTTRVAILIFKANNMRRKQGFLFI